MNIAVAGASTPSVCSAGPITTQEMMKDAVTGTASPSTRIAPAASTAVTTSTTSGLELTASPADTRMSARLCPSPVLTMTDVMMPAAAHTVTIGMTARMPAASARYTLTT